MKKSILLIGTSSKSRITGVRLAFDLLISGLKKRDFDFQVLDLDLTGSSKSVGSFNFARAFGTLRIFAIYFTRITSVNSCYIQISSSLLGFFRDFLFIWPAKILQKRIILHLHGGGYLEFYNRQSAWFQNIIRCTLGQAEVIIVLGKSLCDQFGFIPGISKKLRIVPNGLPIQQLSKLDEPKNIPDSKPLRLLYLSNLIISKGYLDLLEACNILSNKFYIPIKCDFCGEFISVSNDADEIPPNQAKKHFFELINKWSLTDQVSYHGVVSGNAKNQFLMDANILILPTYYPGEGQPLSIIEAFAFFTPVIATAHCGIPDQVLNGFNGFLVENKSPGQIAEAVKEMYEDNNLYRKMSQNSRNYYIDNFTQEDHIKNMVSVLFED